MKKKKKKKKKKTPLPKGVLDDARKQIRELQTKLEGYEAVADRRSGGISSSDSSGSSTDS